MSQPASVGEAMSRAGKGTAADSPAGNTQPLSWAAVTARLRIVPTVAYSFPTDGESTTPARFRF